MGGQKTLRPYWRNYFERTDAVVWVVDSGDVDRLRDCRDELWNLLGEEVRGNASHVSTVADTPHCLCARSG